jgi:hypothetical protein
LERPVGTVAVAVLDVDAEHLLKVSSLGDQQPVQALGPHRADPALGVGVGVAAASVIRTMTPQPPECPLLSATGSC